VQNELTAERRDQSHWMLHLDTEDKNGHKETYEVIETKRGDLKQPILIDGHELTAEQRQASGRQLGRELRDLQKAHKEENQDFGQSQQMLSMLPNAFIFNYGEKRGDLVQLDFKPNPQYRPHSHEAEVFHAMQGSVWIDTQQSRLAEISGRLIERVEFAGGLLGHLDRGGTFDVKQQEVAAGYWELTRLDVEMQGKVLFFKTISVYQKHSRSEFKRVPDDLTIAQAAEMLKKQGASQQVSRITAPR